MYNLPYPIDVIESAAIYLYNSTPYLSYIINYNG